MKTLEKHTVNPIRTLEKFTMVYDSDCPLCMAYTSAFINSKMLDKEGRIPYQQVGGNFCPEIDAERAKNEIALVNRETGKVHYGLDSLLLVLGFRYPVLGKIVRLQPLNFLVKQLYSFISYNRKVIIPAPKSNASTFDCTPTFNLKYRVAYIIFTWIITSIVLVNYSTLLLGVIPETNFYREFLICGGQVLFQAIALTLVTRSKHWDYLGNMLTVSLIGAILLLPALLVGFTFAAIPPVVFLAYFMLVVGVMLCEHARRMKVLELGWWPSASWVLYRLIVLFIVTYPNVK